MQEFKGQATPEQIAEWKDKYGIIYEVKVDGHICYLKKPTRHTMAYASVMLKESPFQYIEEIFNDCKIGGSDIFDKDDDYFFGAVQVVQELIQVKSAEIVKL